MLVRGGIYFFVLGHGTFGVGTAAVRSVVAVKHGAKAYVPGVKTTIQGTAVLPTSLLLLMARAALEQTAKLFEDSNAPAKKPQQI